MEKQISVVALPAFRSFWLCLMEAWDPGSAGKEHDQLSSMGILGTLKAISEEMFLILHCSLSP